MIFMTFHPRTRGRGLGPQIIDFYRFDYLYPCHPEIKFDGRPRDEISEGMVIYLYGPKKEIFHYYNISIGNIRILEYWNIGIFQYSNIFISNISSRKYWNIGIFDILKFQYSNIFVGNTRILEY